MKKIIDVLVVNKEEDITLAQRREDYALKRDMQASEFNEAINRRLLLSKTAMVKCLKCGREFNEEKGSNDFFECPECR